MRTITALAIMALAISTCRAEPAVSPAFMEGESAALEEMTCFVGTIEQGALVFTDRNFVFHAPPQGLKGMTYLKASINGELPVSIAKAGLLTVITPSSDVKGAFCSQVAKLEEAGFTWIQAPPIFQLFGDNKVDQCRIYQKEVAAGEKLLLPKWSVIAGFNPVNLDFFRPNDRVKRAIDRMLADERIADGLAKSQDMLVNQPDYVVFIPRNPMGRSHSDPMKTGDTYNDHFQVIENDGKLYAF